MKTIKQYKSINNTIKKILIGKVFRIFIYKNEYVILGIRYNNYNSNNIDILSGEIRYNNIHVLSWSTYNRKNILFVGRSSKEKIKKCLKKNPIYIKYHVGKYIKLKDYNIIDNYLDQYKKYSL